MLKKKIQTIINQSRPHGWILEPDAKQILKIQGITVPRFDVAQHMDQAFAIAAQLGYPVVAKIISPQILHKSDAGGVVTNIQEDGALKAAFHKFSRCKGFCGMLVEEMKHGVELIVGGKVDEQFGPVVLLGIGGTGVELYKDTALRMAPIQENDVYSMIQDLTGSALLYGFRGAQPVNLDALCRLVTAFSDLFVQSADQIMEIDLNPVICSDKECLVADARMMLKL